MLIFSVVRFDYHFKRNDPFCFLIIILICPRKQINEIGNILTSTNFVCFFFNKFFYLIDHTLFPSSLFFYLPTFSANMSNKCQLKTLNWSKINFSSDLKCAAQVKCYYVTVITNYEKYMMPQNAFRRRIEKLRSHWNNEQIFLSLQRE